MYTTLLALVTLACVAFGAVIIVDETDLNKDLEELYEELRVSNALSNATKLLNRGRRAAVTDTSKHGVTPDERILALKIHNKLRGQVNPPATSMIYMRWNWKLAELAQQWADACAYHHGQPEHDKKLFPAIGQNLWVSTGGHDIEGAVDLWYQEKVNYQYGPNKCAESKMCGHYTQVVWGNSAELGCGIAYCQKTQHFGNRKAYYIVCNYSPAGNYVGEKPYTAGSFCSDCPKSRPRCKNNLCREDPPCNTKKCLNGGSVDTATCECKCGVDFQGSSCESGAVGDGISRLQVLTMLFSVLLSNVVFV